MSAIQADFDRIALLGTDGWNHNNHYHNFLLRQVPPDCRQVLEIGCGTGTFSRLLAERSQNVLALDLSPEMIRVARARSAQFPNIEFQVADVMAVLPTPGSSTSWKFPAEPFDCIASIATLHHLPLREMLLRMKAALKPGGVLLVLDLFEPERDLLTPAGLLDAFLNALAVAVSGSLRLIHDSRLRSSREVRDAWAEHERHDSYPTFSQVRELCGDILAGSRVRRHLLWRYSIVWQKP
jgi:SAM-dependent methyltransferase